MKLANMKNLAGELQKVLDLKPKLEFKGSKREFKRDILEASLLLTDDDELSMRAEKLLRILKKKNFKGKEVEKKEKTEDKIFEIKKEKEELVSAARNLNKELGLKPKINIYGTFKELQEGILGASSLVKKEEAGIKKATFRVIKKLKESYLNKKEGKGREMKVKEKVKKTFAKPEAKTKVKRQGLGGRDEFGFRIGSKNNFFAKSLILKPKTMLEIRHEKWNTTSTTFYTAWGEIVKMGRGQRTPEGVMKIISLKKKH